MNISVVIESEVCDSPKTLDLSLSAFCWSWIEDHPGPELVRLALQHCPTYQDNGRTFFFFFKKQTCVSLWHPKEINWLKWLLSHSLVLYVKSVFILYFLIIESYVNSKERLRIIYFFRVSKICNYHNYQLVLKSFLKNRNHIFVMLVNVSK